MTDDSVVQEDNLLHHEGMLQFSPVQNVDGAAFLHQTYNKMDPASPAWHLATWASMPMSEERAAKTAIMGRPLEPSTFDLGLKARHGHVDNEHLFYKACAFDVTNVSLPVPAWPMQDWAQEWAVIQATGKALQALVNASVSADAH